MTVSDEVAKDHYEAGLVHARGHAYDEAILEFDQAIADNPNYYRNYYVRGLAWYKKGNLLRALDDFDQTLRINPNSKQAKEYRREVRRRLGVADPLPVAFAAPSSAKITLNDADLGLLSKAAAGGVAALCFYLVLSWWNAGFSTADIDEVKAKIRTQMFSGPGLVVEDVAMIRENSRKLSGFAKVRIRDLDLTLTKTCSAVMGEGREYILSCE